MSHVVQLSQIISKRLALAAFSGLVLVVVINTGKCVAVDDLRAAASDSAGKIYAQGFSRTLLLRRVGRQIFSDPAFSKSGRQSCASCHSPAYRYNPPNALDVQPGGGDLRARGLRAPPTLTYLNRVPPYSNHFYDSDEEADDSIDNGPAGGLNWDGRVDTGADQALIPLVSAQEMANTPAGVARAVRASAVAPLLREALGAHALDSDADAFKAVAHALGAFEEDYAEFSPYTSKYDAFLTGMASFSDEEKSGLDLFNREDKGNCAHCHIARRGRDGGAPALSDYGLIALAVPRNRNIPRNRDTAFFDLGACGPERRDKADDADFCGLFRTPTLRNVALRQTFFHNGKFHNLRDVVDFYVTRDITPERWYPRDSAGVVQIYDDLPVAYRDNINREPPFENQHPGAKPNLSASEIDAVVAFMKTLNDGFLKENPYRAERERLR